MKTNFEGVGFSWDSARVVVGLGGIVKVPAEAYTYWL